ncbi:MAG: LptF/LptG family permease [Bacteroidales bacterium]|nr:LptF/LptG family permease [Bacteroidales bacterium]
MKKLDIFLLKSYFGPLIATFFISLFVLLMQFLWKYIDDLVGKGLESSVIAEFLGLASISLIPMALPLAILLASIMTFGNLGEKFELTAIKASGISLQRTMTPLIILTLIISIGAFFIANDIIPYANLKFRALIYSIQSQRPEMNIKPGIFNNDIQNFSIRVSKKNPKTNMMYDFIVYDHTKDKGCKSVTVADSGSMTMTADGRYMLVTLYNGISYDEMDNRTNGTEKKYPFRKDVFKKQTFLFNLSGFDFNRSDESLFRNSYQVQDIFRLTRSTDSLQGIYNRRTEDLSENLTSHYYLKRATHRDREFKDSILRTRVNKPHVQSQSRDLLNPDELSSEDYAKQDSAYKHEDSIIKLKIAINKDSLRNFVYSVDTKDLKIAVDLDSIYANMSEQDKQSVINKTKEFATEAQSLITRNEEDFISRKRLIARFRNAWHQKFTLSFACLIFFFIGAPLGAIIRKGGFGLPIVVSVLVFLIYYMISTAGMKMAREGVWEPWQGMWLSSFIILPLGIFLTYKATVDAQIFNKEAWAAFFKKIGGFFSGLKRFSDTYGSQKDYPVRNSLQVFAYVAGGIAFGLSFSPMKKAAIGFGIIGLVLAGIVIILNKKYKFKSKFAILAVIICSVSIILAATSVKKKKQMSEKPATEQVEKN